MSNQYKITIDKVDSDGKVVTSVDASINQDIILHLAKHHKIDGIDEIFKIAKEQFYDKLNQEQSPYDTEGIQ
jgi:hypothetical protein